MDSEDELDLTWLHEATSRVRHGAQPRVGNGPDLRVFLTWATRPRPSSDGRAARHVAD